MCAMFIRRKVHIVFAIKLRAFAGSPPSPELPAVPSPVCTSMYSTMYHGCMDLWIYDVGNGRSTSM